MAGPSKHNRRLKAKNDRRKKQRASGGRTPAEAALGRSMAAAGYPVSKSNQRVGKGYRGPGYDQPSAPIIAPSKVRARAKSDSSVQRLSKSRARSYGAAGSTNSVPVLRTYSTGTGSFGMSFTGAGTAPSQKYVRSKSDRQKIKSKEARLQDKIDRRAKKIERLQDQLDSPKAPSTSGRSGRWVHQSSAKPKPAPIGPVRPKPSRKKIQEQIDKQRKLQKRDRLEKKKTAITRQELSGQEQKDKNYKGPRTKKEVENWSEDVTNRILGDSAIGKALRKGKYLPKYKAPKASKGGRTAGEISKALEMMASGQNVSKTNLTAAKGAWKGQQPDLQEAINMTAIPRVPTPPTLAPEVVKKPKLRDRLLIAATRERYEKAAKSGIPAARPENNPFAISDANAPKNETPEQKFRRERAVLNKMIRENKGFGIELLDPESQQKYTDRIGGDAVNFLIDTAAFSEIGRDIQNRARYVMPKEGSLEAEILKQTPLGVFQGLAEGGNPNIEGTDTLLETLSRVPDTAARDKTGKLVPNEAGFGSYLSAGTSVGLANLGRKIALGGLGLGIAAWSGRNISFGGQRLGVLGSGIAQARGTKIGNFTANLLNKLPTEQWRTIRRTTGWTAVGAAGVDVTLSGINTAFEAAGADPVIPAAPWNDEEAYRSYVAPVIGGIFTANVSESLTSTARNLITAIVYPFTVAANVGVTARRGLRAIGDFADGDVDPYYGSMDYVFQPVTTLVKESWDEIQFMADTFTSRDIDRIREVTEQDLGYISLMSGYWLTRTTVGDSVSHAAKKIAHSPVGMRVAAELAQNRLTAPGVKVYKSGKRSVDVWKEKGRAVAAAGRAVGEADWLSSTMRNQIAKNLQVYRSIPGTKKRIKEMQKVSDAYAAAHANAKYSKGAPTQVGVEDLVTLFATIGFDPSKGKIADLEKRLNSVEVVPGGTEHRLLTHAIEGKDLWEQDGSARAKVFMTMYKGARDSGDIIKEIRNKWAEETLGGARQMLRDRAITANEFLAIAKSMGVGDGPELLDDLIDAEFADAPKRKEEAEARLQSIKATVNKLLGKRDQNVEVVERLVEEQRTAIDNELYDRETVATDSAERGYMRAAKGDIPTLNELQARITMLDSMIQRGEGDPALLKEMRKESRALRNKLEKAKRRIKKVYVDLDEKRAKQQAALDRVEADLRKEKVSAAREERVVNVARRQMKDGWTKAEREAAYLDLEPHVRRAIEQDTELGERIAALELDQDLKSAEVQRLREAAKLIEDGPEAEQAAIDELAEMENTFDELTKAFDRLPEGPAKDVLQRMINHVSDVIAQRHETVNIVQELRTHTKSKRKQLKALKDRRLKLSGDMNVARDNLDRLRIQQEANERMTDLEGLADAIERQEVADFFEQERDIAMEKVVRQLEERAEEAKTLVALEDPTYIRHQEEVRGTPPPTAGAQESPLSVAEDARRTGELQGTGQVDRGFGAFTSAQQREVDRNTARNIIRILAKEGVVGIEWDDGSVRTVFSQDELPRAIELYKKQYGGEANQDLVIMKRDWLDDPDDFNELVRPTGDAKKSSVKEIIKKTEDDHDFKRVDLEAHVVHDPAFDGKQPEMARRAFGEEPGYIFVKAPWLDTFKALHSDVEGLHKIAFWFNRVSSRLVLGSSLAWMFAQPIAEMAVAMAQHPSQVWRRLPEVKEIRAEGGASARILAKQAETTPGADPASGRRTRPGYQEEQRRVKETVDTVRRSPGMVIVDAVVEEDAKKSRFKAPKEKGKTFWRKAAEAPQTNMQRGAVKDMAVQVATLRAPGNIDRWKAGWIREAAFLANLDHHLKPLTRASKSVKGQLDIIEKYADMLSKMTREEQLKWIDSKEGMEVGMALAKEIDDQLGNWQDLRPGIEAGIGQVIFFYPFVRFSLNWALRTYPKDHPVVWTLAMIMGAANTNILQEMVDHDPMWPTDWAVVPIFGGPNGEITSLTAVNRFNSASNGFTELALNESTDPWWSASKIALPPLTMGIQLIAGKDEFGNDYGESTDDFGQEDPGGWMRVGQLAQQAFSLVAPYRIFSGISGFSMRNLGEMIGARGIPQTVREVFNVDERSVDLTNFVDPLGKDVVDWRSGLRSGALPAWPTPINTFIDDNKYRKLRNQVFDVKRSTSDYLYYPKKENVSWSRADLNGGNARDRLERGELYEDENRETVGQELVKIKRGGKWREMSFQAAGAMLTGERKIDGDRTKGLGMNPRNAYERDIAKQYLAIKGRNQNVDDKLKPIYKKMRNFRYDRGLPIDPNSAEGVDKQQRNDDFGPLSLDWKRKFPYTDMPKSRQTAEKLLKDDLLPGIGNKRKPTPTEYRDLAPESVNAAREMDLIIANSRQRLSRAGVRRVDRDRINLNSLTPQNQKVIRNYQDSLVKKGELKRDKFGEYYFPMSKKESSYRLTSPEEYRDTGEMFVDVPPNQRRSRTVIDPLLTVQMKDALLDPGTELYNGKNNEIMVKKWRGVRVLGNVSLADIDNKELRRSEGVAGSPTYEYRYHRELDAIMLPNDFQKQRRAEQQADRLAKLARRAAKLEAKSRPSSGLSGDEGRFVEELARLSKLSPRVVAAWTRLEGGNSFGDWNRLNIGHTDSGPIEITYDPRWGDPVQAAQLSHSFLKGEFGGPSEGIKAILPNAVGKSDEQQIAIITGSGWATDPDYSTKVADVYNGLPQGAPADPKAAQKLKALKEELTQEGKSLTEINKELKAAGLKPVEVEGQRVGYGLEGAQKPLPGPYSGARRAVSMLLGQPVWGDHMPTATSPGGPDEGPDSHTTAAEGGFHAMENSYAQDIGTSGGRPEEGEGGLGYNQETMDKIAAGLRKMGADIDTLTIGQDYEAVLPNGYEVQLLTSAESGHADHIHLGMKWVGPGGATTGSISGGSAGYVGGGGSVAVGSMGGGAASGMAGLMGTGGMGGTSTSWRDLPFGEVQSGGGTDYEDGGVDASVTAMAEESEPTTEDADVKSGVEQMAALPQVRKKKKVPRFSNNPI